MPFPGNDTGSVTERKAVGLFRIVNFTLCHHMALPAILIENNIPDL